MATKAAAQLKQQSAMEVDRFSLLMALLSFKPHVQSNGEHATWLQCEQRREGKIDLHNTKLQQAIAKTFEAYMRVYATVQFVNIMCGGAPSASQKAQPHN